MKLLAGSGYPAPPYEVLAGAPAVSHRLNKGRPITGDAQKENPVLNKTRPRLARCQYRKRLRRFGKVPAPNRRRKHKSLAVTQVFVVEASSQRPEPTIVVVTLSLDVEPA